MAVLLDFNQCVIAVCHALQNSRNGIPLTEDVIRHVSLDSIRQYRQKYKKYGDLIICCDNGSWRKEAFAYYKAHREFDRQQSFMPWDVIFSSIRQLQEDLREYFPYRVISVPTAEADDLIAILTRELTADGQEVMIVSSDNDFKQLQAYPGVRQYSPILKKELKVADPHRYLREHIIKGDKGDGVPNIRSDDDTFVMKKRSKPITEKFLEEYMTKDLKYFDDELKRNFQRNNKMVNLLESIPEELQASIINAYTQAKHGDRSRMMNYMITRRLRNLMEKLQEF